MEVVRGEEFEVCWESGETGQAGSVALMLIDNDGDTVWTFDTSDIIETPASSGIYCANRTAPVEVGHYTIIFSIDGTLDPGSISTTDLFVVATSSSTSLPPLDGDDLSGPCSAWTTSEDVFACCSADVGSDTSVFDDAVDAAEGHGGLAAIAGQRVEALALTARQHHGERVLQDDLGAGQAPSTSRLTADEPPFCQDWACGCPPGRRRRTRPG